MSKLIMSLVVLTGMLVGGFYIFNNYIYYEKQAGEAVSTELERDIYSDKFIDESIGITFDYVAGPDGYAIDDLSAFIGEDLIIEVVKVYRIMNAIEKYELENSEGGREGPPAIQFMVFRNDLNQTASEWVKAFPSFSNVEMVIGDVDYNFIVDGASAVRYTTDGLYVTDNVVLTSDNFIYHFTGSYHEIDSTIHQDFEAIIDSIEFITNTSAPLKVPKIIISSPVINQKVSNPIPVTGQAQGSWFFEATAPMVVVNWDGLIIGESYIEADGEWMTEDMVSFHGVINYSLPVDSYSNSGTLIIHRTNPSGLPEHDAAIEIPIVLDS